MSSVTQNYNNANINNQINIDGNVTIHEKEKSSIVYVSAIGKEKFLPSLVKSRRKNLPSYDQKQLEVEPDFEVAILPNMLKDFNFATGIDNFRTSMNAALVHFRADKFSIGQKIKFIVSPGDYTIFIYPNQGGEIGRILQYGLDIHDFPSGVTWFLLFDITHKQRQHGFPYPASRSLPIRAGEVINLNFTPPTINFA